MMDQLNAFAAEVPRLAHEVGTDGKLGGLASVPGVAGTWKGLICVEGLKEETKGVRPLTI